MSQALPNPLRELHSQPEADFQHYGDLEIVSTFGQPEAEYAAIRKGAGLMDLPQRGILEVSGKDRLSFLNNLLTNQTWDKATKTGLAAHCRVYAYFLNNKGRIVADMNVLELGERTWLETDLRMVEVLRTGLERYVFAEQVKLASQVGVLHRMAVHGPEALSVLSDAAGGSISELSALGSVEAALCSVPVTIFRDDQCAVPGYHVVVATGQAPALWSALMSQFSNPLELGKRRLRGIGWAAYNACRIEAARPLFDIDFGNSANPDESTLPAESGQFERAVSVTKGCYLGQEVVARMHARQQLAKKLVGLRIEGAGLPIAGAAITDEKGESVGMITSSTVSPMLSNACIALGWVKRPYFQAGMKVRVPAEGKMVIAEVVYGHFIPHQST